MRYFFAPVPHPVFGAADECEPSDADNALDKPVPSGLLECGTGIENLDDAALGAHVLAPVGGIMAV